MTKRLAFKRALMYHYGINYDKKENKVEFKPLVIFDDDDEIYDPEKLLEEEDEEKDDEEEEKKELDTK